jgi:EAL domain-containing protein (putative c-di-GMP-specific phosphodiesterase class I)/GGDEF domain-containing protein
MSNDRNGPSTGAAPESAPRRRPSPRLTPQALLDTLAAHCGTRVTERTALLVVSLNRSDRLQALAQDPTNQHVLAEIARRVQSMLRPSDRYAFVANDELWLMLASLPDESLAELAGSTLRDTLQRSIHVPRADGSELEVRLRPVVGGAWTAQRSIADPMAMVTAASQACSRARIQESQILIARLDDDAALMRRDALERDLRNALQANALDVHFQPQIDLKTGRCVAVESLIRWNRSDGSAVNPALIASICEERGMMGALTQFVLNNALRSQKRWANQGFDLALSINLSPTVMADATFPMLVSHALATWNVPGERLILELTESAIAQNEQSAIEFMGQLRALGCRLSLDDFGTGYSSLAWFDKLPLDELKIDRSFVREIETAGSDAPSRTVRALIGLARAYGLRVLAEAVESPRVARLLADAGCDLAQGYHFSPALPAPAVVEWCRRHDEASLIGRHDRH